MDLTKEQLQGCRFAWNPKKLSRKQHIVRPDGGIFCKLHHSTAIRNLTHISETVHPTRRVCDTCIAMLKEDDTGNGKSNTEFRRGVPNKKRYKSRDPFVHTWEWKQVRYMALKANDGHCELCGRSKQDGAILNVDHIKPRRQHPELALTLSNLQVLCSACNQGKGNWDETDWRESRLSKLMGEGA